MDSLFARHRNTLCLLLALFGQILLLAWQVKSDNDVPLVRVWAVSAVTPVASLLESLRHGTTDFFSSYFELRDARAQNGQLRGERDRLRVENQILKDELSVAQRAQAMAGFQTRTPSKMIGARVIGQATGMGTRSVLIDRGTTSGVRRGMAVVTPDGIVGKVSAVYLTASQVLAVTDPAFAAGVESQKSHVRGVLKGLGSSGARVDYVSSGRKVEVGELFFTSGEDRVFPRGFPAAKVTSVKDSASFQDIQVEPAWSTLAPEEVLVILDPVHQSIPELAPAESPVFLAPDVSLTADTPGNRGTQANTVLDKYRKAGEAPKSVSSPSAVPRPSGAVVKPPVTIPPPAPLPPPQ